LFITPDMPLIAGGNNSSPKTKQCLLMNANIGKGVKSRSLAQLMQECVGGKKGSSCKKYGDEKNAKMNT
jgi:hypothetical protein